MKENDQRDRLLSDIIISFQFNEVVEVCHHTIECLDLFARENTMVRGLIFDESKLKKWCDENNLVYKSYEPDSDERIYYFKQKHIL